MVPCKVLEYLFYFYEIGHGYLNKNFIETVLNKCGDSGHRCLVPDTKENDFSFSPLSMMLTVGFSYTAFIMLRCAPSSHFVECFLS